VPELPALALAVNREVVLEAEVVEVGMPIRQDGERADRVDPPERDVGVRVVIEEVRTVRSNSMTFDVSPILLPFMMPCH
jgi:hypothetical protein